MKIKVKEKVLDYENKDILTPGSENPLTWFDVFINALNGRVPDEAPLPAELKSKIYQISKKTYDSKEPDFTDNQIAILKDRVGLTHSAMVYGRFLELIGEGTPTEKEPETPKDSSAN